MPLNNNTLLSTIQNNANDTTRGATTTESVFGAQSPLYPLLILFGAACSVLLVIILTEKYGEHCYTKPSTAPAAQGNEPAPNAVAENVGEPPRLPNDASPSPASLLTASSSLLEAGRRTTSSLRSYGALGATSTGVGVALEDMSEDGSEEYDRHGSGAGYVLDSSS